MRRGGAVRGAAGRALAVALLAGCARLADTGGPFSRAEPADRIFVGEVVTVDEKGTVAEAVAVKGGRVLAVGAEREVLRHRGPETEVVDLLGAALLPGFVDAHSHLVAHGIPFAGFANAARPPVGTVQDIPGLLEVLREHARARGLAPGEWLVATGYEREALAEGRDVTRRDLDPHFPETPVVLIHVSSHGAVLNSAALAAADIDADTPAPPGGLIVREPGSREPAGLLMETAFFAVAEALPEPGPDETLEGLRAAQLHYAANGYTTVNDGATSRAGLDLLRAAAAGGELFLDVVALPDWTLFPELARDPGVEWGVYDGRLKLAGVKVLLDGAPQARTAWFSEPYRVPGPGGEPDWSGEPVLPRQEVEAVFALAKARGVQTFTHANADAAIDLYLDVRESVGLPLSARPVVIHSQFPRPDQLDVYAATGTVPSFFTNHTFFWGDVHVQNLGRERAFFSSPLRSATERNLRFSNHSDYGVTPLDPAFMLWTASERISRSGQIIGPEERISIAEALRALTIDAAYQYFEETEKGSIEPGKLADLVVVDRNPLTATPDELRGMRVLETIKEGETIWTGEG